MALKIKMMLVLIIPQLVLVFGQIYKSSMYLKFSYLKQRNLKIVDELTERKNELARQFGQLTSQKNIKEYAVKNGLETVKLKNIKKITELYEHQPVSGTTH